MNLKIHYFTGGDIINITPFSHKYLKDILNFMAEISQNIKYVKLDDGVSFALVRTNPKLTTNTKLMYNGKKMQMESYASGELLNRAEYKNVHIKQNSTFNRDIANFLIGSGSQSYDVYQNFSDTVISDSYDNQFETLYWCGAEYIDSSFYEEEIGFVAPLYLREKLPNYFLIFRLDTPSNYNFTVDESGNVKDSTFNFKTDILDKAVLIKTFDLREGSVLGNYIHNYVNQDGFEFDKSMYVNFSNSEVTYYGISKRDGVLEKKVESFKNELLGNDKPILKDDKWFTEGFERNGLIFPYIMNIEYLFNDDNFKNNEEESYDFARYIGVYCNNIEFGEFADFSELKTTEDNAIYYFEDNKGKLHRYIKTSIDGGGYNISIDGKVVEKFDMELISGFEKERITGYAEPLDIYEGFINRAQYGFEILKPLEPGDWIGIEYNGHVDCYFADDTNVATGDAPFERYSMSIGEYSDFRFSVSGDSSVNDIAEALAKSINHNKRGKFEARYSDNVVVIYAKREGKEYNGSETGGAKILMEASLIYNRKISLPISNNMELFSGDSDPVENISDSDTIVPAYIIDNNGNIIGYEKSSFGSYYKDFFCGACDADIDSNTDTYKNVFKIYEDERVFFDIGRYLKTNNGDGREICVNMVYINSEGKIEPEYRIVIVDDVPDDKKGDKAFDISVSSTYQVEIMDRFKPNHGVLSWFPVKDFDFDINYSSYGQYTAFADECNRLSKKYTRDVRKNISRTDVESGDGVNNAKEDYVYREGIKDIAKSPFIDDYDNYLETEYDYYHEQFNPDLCLMSKTTPYILKWGYYDEQKDSCENPYRLNVNKIFGVSNLSANTYLRDCDENHYTHSMPYYMTLNTPDYQKNYQYIASDFLYSDHFEDKNIEFNTFYDCVDYWVNKVFMRTDEDKFSQFFSGKKYGNRFDRKYSRFLGGDKFHNSSTLFRGVKFEVVRQYNGLDKRTSEYNDYKFSFVYIPVMLKDMIFNSTIYFVKNDTFKFIVGIIFVNTMLGVYNHNIFNGNVDYFGKGFLYAACKDVIRAQNSESYNFKLILTITSDSSDSDSSDFDFKEKEVSITDDSFKSIWEANYPFGEDSKIFYMWLSTDDEKTKTIFVSKDRYNISKNNIIGKFEWDENKRCFDFEKLKNINLEYTIDESYDGGFKITWNKYYSDYDTTIYGYNIFEYCGEIECKMVVPNIEFKDNRLVDVCAVDWEYRENNFGYVMNCRNLHITSESLQNILINMGIKDSIVSIRFHQTVVEENVDGTISEKKIIDKTYKNVTVDGQSSDGNSTITVDINSGDITITILSEFEGLINTSISHDTASIEGLMIDIVIKDRFDTNKESLGLKDYFSVFNQLSMCNITESINEDYNIRYHSTVEDNKYKIRVIEPDSIEIKDKYESIPVTVLQNNKRIVGSVKIKEKQDVDKIGIKVVNRYSGFYNPIFNDILYYGDYSYSKSYSALKKTVNFEMPYSNTYINYNYDDGYGQFGVIKNMYYHKTNTNRSDKILTSVKPVYPAINEYALDYRDYNIFSSSWDEGYFASQDDISNSSVCSGIGSMKDGLCMFGSKYLNLPDYIFIDTFENGKVWNEKMMTDIRDNTNIELMFKEINGRTVMYHLFIEKRLKRYLVEHLLEVFSKYINKEFSFGNTGTIEDDVEEYVEKNVLKMYKIDKVYMYVKDEQMGRNNRRIENEYLMFMNINNKLKFENGFPGVAVGDDVKLKDSKFIMKKTNELDRDIIYNLKNGYKESFGFGVSFRRK